MWAVPCFNGLFVKCPSSRWGWAVDPCPVADDIGRGQAFEQSPTGCPRTASHSLGRQVGSPLHLSLVSCLICVKDYGSSYFV